MTDPILNPESEGPSGGWGSVKAIASMLGDSRPSPAVVEECGDCPEPSSIRDRTSEQTAIWRTTLIVVHHLNNSRSHRIIWMLEELGLPYDIHRYERDPSTMIAPPEMRLVHPLGKSPILEDTDGSVGHVTLVETGAICEYLADKAGGHLGCPSDRASALLYRQFLHYAEGSVMPPMLAMLVVRRVPLLGRFAAMQVRPMLDVHLDYVEQELAGRPWFAGGEITAADIMMSFPLEAARSHGLVGNARPDTVAWIDKIHARPAYQRALQKGGSYAFAK